MSLEMLAAAITAAFVAGFSAGNDWHSHVPFPVEAFSEAAFISNAADSYVKILSSENDNVIHEQIKVIKELQGDIDALLVQGHAAMLEVACLVNFNDSNNPKIEPALIDEFFSRLNSVGDRLDRLDLWEQLGPDGFAVAEVLETLISRLMLIGAELQIVIDGLQPSTPCSIIDPI